MIPWALWLRFSMITKITRLVFCFVFIFFLFFSFVKAKPGHTIFKHEEKIWYLLNDGRKKENEKKGKLLLKATQGLVDHGKLIFYWTSAGTEGGVEKSFFLIYTPALIFIFLHQVFSVRSGGATGIVVKSPGRPQKTFVLEDKGPILSIKLNPDQKVINWLISFIFFINSSQGYILYISIISPPPTGHNFFLTLKDAFLSRF